MPVVEWDSYIVQRRDLIQYLIGHIDIDADLATRQPLMSSSQWRGAAGPQQHIIIKMEGVPRQNMSGQRSYRLCRRRGHQGCAVDVVGVAEQILQADIAQTLQRILLLPLFMTDQHHHVGWRCIDGWRE